MTNASAPWWEVIGLRDEVTSSGGAIDDVQMSLHNAVFGKEGVGAGLTPYSDAGLLRQHHPSDRQPRGVDGTGGGAAWGAWIDSDERYVAARSSYGWRQVARADRVVASRGASPRTRSNRPRQRGHGGSGEHRREEERASRLWATRSVLSWTATTQPRMRRTSALRADSESGSCGGSSTRTVTNTTPSRITSPTRRRWLKRSAASVGLC